MVSACVKLCLPSACIALAVRRQLCGASKQRSVLTWYTPGGSSLTMVKSLPERCMFCRVVQLSKDPSTSTCSPPWLPATLAHSITYVSYGVVPGHWSKHLWALMSRVLYIGLPRQR